MVSKNYRWFVVAIFFVFMLLHQADKLLIGPMTTDIMDTFQISKTQMGAVFTGALIVGAIFYPLWGYLYDRYARAKLLAIAAFLWGATTWFGAIAPTYGLFLFSRASTGIDDSSYPGLYSLISDYFEPKVRGKIYGLLQLTQPVGYLLGMLLALLLSGTLGWRSIFYITGSLGIVLSIVILFGVKETQRGSAEPELAGVEQPAIYKFNWTEAKGLFKKKSLILIFIQGFFGVFPWNVITYWFFAYLEIERGYTQNQILITMVVAVLVLAVGYPVGGALGDRFFQKNPKGRVNVATMGVLAGAVLLTITMFVPIGNPLLFGVMLMFTALFIPFASPNVISTVYDITVPEVRSTTLAVQYFIESAGAALAPLLAGFIADQSSLHTAILSICISTWIICGIVFAMVRKTISFDVEMLHRQLLERTVKSTIGDERTQNKVSLESITAD